MLRIIIVSICIYIIICTYMCMFKTLQRHGLWRTYSVKKHIKTCWFHSIFVITLQCVVLYLLND